MDKDDLLVVGRVQEIASVEVDDGLTFQVEMTQMTTIREEDQYTGLRVVMPATLGKAHIRLALDINFGDPVTPGAAFEILAYPIETVLAEKIVTAIARGETNTRERDWADIWRLSGAHDLDAETPTDRLRTSGPPSRW